MLDRLAWSDMFETFLANKYTAAKRFGLEGAESLIPGMKTIIDTGADLGVQSVVIGMPHRGGCGRRGGMDGEVRHEHLSVFIASRVSCRMTGMGVRRRRCELAGGHVFDGSYIWMGQGGLSGVCDTTRVSVT